MKAEPFCLTEATDKEAPHNGLCREGWGWGAHLEHREKRLREIVKGAPLGLRLVEIKLASKQLHPEQGEDDDEEEEQEQQRSDGLHGV